MKTNPTNHPRQSAEARLRSVKLKRPSELKSYQPDGPSPDAVTGRETKEELTKKLELDDDSEEQPDRLPVLEKVTRHFMKTNRAKRLSRFPLKVGTEEFEEWTAAVEQAVADLVEIKERLRRSSYNYDEKTAPYLNRWLLACSELERLSKVYNTVMKNWCAAEEKQGQPEKAMEPPKTSLKSIYGASPDTVVLPLLRGMSGLERKKLLLIFEYLLADLEGSRWVDKQLARLEAVEVDSNWLARVKSDPEVVEISHKAAGQMKQLKQINENYSQTTSTPSAA